MISSELWDQVLNVGLIFGAIFQMLCLAAVFWVPGQRIGFSRGDSGAAGDGASPSLDDTDYDYDYDDGQEDEASNAGPRNAQGGGNRRGRRDNKKKRR